ncbi:TPA: phage tail assembly protein [Pseudomonas aeruginosa]|uniref:phage tail assembly protein n=1 Tax=Pseudomonas aeruginosa TaxID=287 RepID=UPI0034D709A4
MKNEKNTATPAEDQTITDNFVVLDQHIKRGEQIINTLTLRKPSSGELRGLNLLDLLQFDVAATIKILPRISQPTITEPEAAGMDPADLLACSQVIAGFLLQKRAKAAASLIA